MRWGFAWELGPFELWDVFGVERMAQRLQQEKRELPPLVTRLLASRQKAASYESAEGELSRRSSLPLAALRQGPRATRHHYSEIASRPLARDRQKCRRQPHRSRRRRPLLRISRQDERHRRRHRGHAPSRRQTPLRGFRRHGGRQPSREFFPPAPISCCCLVAAQEQEWDDLHLAVRQFQNANLALKHAPRPVIVAPQGLALGGGCEVCLHGTRIQAAAEAYIEPGSRKPALA